MIEQDTVVSQEKFDEMVAELENLKTVRRTEIAKNLEYARSLGDLSENAEYQDARARLSRIDGRIFGLQERLKNAILINENAGQSGLAQIGSTVVLRVQGEEKTYQILGSQETNPSRGRISCLSPLGAALLDHVAHESITVNTPQGAIVYEIVDVK